MNQPISKVWAIRHEIYTFTFQPSGKQVTWDVSKAKEMVRKGEVFMKMPVPREQLEIIVKTYEWQEEAVKSADLAWPGIGAPIIVEEDGHLAITYTLIDGIHRCIKAYRENKEMFAWTLTDWGSWNCIMQADAETVPLSDPQGQLHPNKAKPETFIRLDSEPRADGTIKVGQFERGGDSPIPELTHNEQLIELDDAAQAKLSENGLHEIPLAFCPTDGAPMFAVGVEARTGKLYVDQKLRCSACGHLYVKTYYDFEQRWEIAPAEEGTDDEAEES